MSEQERTPLPTVVDVDISVGEHGLLVTPVHSGVDRTRSYGIWVNRQSLASRLKAGILAGVVFPVTGVGTDVNGETYAEFTHNVLARRLNADLRNLGF
jgi:hypothetical protein